MENFTKEKLVYSIATLYQNLKSIAKEIFVFIIEIDEKTTKTLVYLNTT